MTKILRERGVRVICRLDEELKYSSKAGHSHGWQDEDHAEQVKEDFPHDP